MEKLQVIDDCNKIRNKNLENNQYTVSLIKEGFRASLLDKQVILKIQEEIILILKELIIRYTKGESTSVTVEAAEKLLNSIYYTIDAYIKSFHNPEESINQLKTKKIKEIYEKGVILITQCVAETKILYREMVKINIDLPNDVYNETINKAIPKFFNDYEVIFNAHDTMADIDYPLIFDDMSIRGIYYIKQYLEKLIMETQFCNNFDKDDIKKVFITGCSNVFRINYEESPVNIFEIMINNSVFSVLVGNNSDKLIITNYEFELIKRKLMVMSPCEIKSAVEGAIEKILKDFCVNDQDLTDYIYRYSKLLSGRIKTAVKNDTLDKMVVTDEKIKHDNKSIIFQDGNSMDDESFRVFFKSVTSSKTTSEKIDLIKCGIHSSTDFFDILDTDCLIGDEFILLFAALGDMELSILGKELFYDELRNGPLNLSPIVDGDRKIPIEKEWQYYYIKFIKICGGHMVKLIEDHINAIDL